MVQDNPSDEKNQTPVNSPSSTDPKENPSDEKNQQIPNAGPFSSLLADFKVAGAAILGDLRKEAEKVKADIIAKHEDHKAWLQSVYEEAKTLPVDFDTLKGNLLGEVENLEEVPLLLKLAAIAVKKAQSLDPNCLLNFRRSELLRS